MQALPMGIFVVVVFWFLFFFCNAPNICITFVVCLEMYLDCPTVIFTHALVLIKVFLSSCRSHNIHILALQKTEMERLQKMKKV